MAGTRSCGRTKNFPTAADLDSVVGDRPVVLERVDGHAYVVNSAAMKAAGVTAQTPPPSGGRIENGLFVDNAKATDRQSDACGDAGRARPGACQGSGHPGELRCHRGRIDEHLTRRLASDAPSRRRRPPECPADGLRRRVEAPVRSAAPNRLALRRPPQDGGHQILCRRRARFPRRLAKATLCRHAEHARASVPFGRGDVVACRPRRFGRISDRDPCDRRRRQCPDHFCLRADVAQIWPRPALAD